MMKGEMKMRLDMTGFVYGTLHIVVWQSIIIIQDIKIIVYRVTFLFVIHFFHWNNCVKRYVRMLNHFNIVEFISYFLQSVLYIHSCQI